MCDTDQREDLGTCGAKLVLGDDYGDNDVTFKCGLSKHHEGDHYERFKSADRKVTVRWEEKAKDSAQG